MSLNSAFNNETLPQRLHAAASKGDVAALADLVITQKVPVDLRDKNGATPLMKAFAEGQYDAAVFLLSKGANPNALDNIAAPVFDYAFIWAQPDIAKRDKFVDLLLAYDADPRAIEPNAQTARTAIATRAAAFGKTKALEGLMKDGVAVDATNAAHETLLMIAAANGREETMRMLLAKGADPNTAHPLGRTPLRAAIEAGQLGAVKVLLAAGADTGAQSRDANNDRITDLQASVSASPEISKAVADAAQRFAVNEAAKIGDTAKLRALLAKGVPADTFDRLHMTALLHAVQGKHQKAVKLLLEYGAKPDLHGKNRLPAIHIAIFNGDKESVQLLGEAGGSTYIKDLGGNTPLERAEKGEDTEMIAVLKKLRTDEVSRVSRNALSVGEDVIAPERAQFKRKGPKR